MIEKNCQIEDEIHVLVVEDSVTQAKKLKHFLEQNKFKVTLALNGAEALSLLKELTPKIIISDIMMPYMDGFELCQKIRENNEFDQVPIILLTSLSDPEDVIKSLQCGANNFIVKPYDEQHLVDRLRHIIANIDLRKNGVDDKKVTAIYFTGKKYQIYSDRQQILDLLLSTYENAYQKNIELYRIRDELRDLNERLEEKVKARTASLVEEIAERKHAEQKIRQLNEELEQRVLERTARLTAVNEELEAFAYSVSHDLRTPLRHIDGFINLLIKYTSTPLDEKCLNYLQKIADSAKRMNNLINDLLTFSRMGRAEMQKKRIDLNQLVERVIHSFHIETVNRNINWKIAELPESFADPRLIELVFMNLISNAIKFTKLKAVAEIEIGWQKLERETIYFIRDNGAGFDMTYVDKLFGVFKRLHPEQTFEGTGIGLANVRRIIYRHGGKTWAEGKLDEGATFYFSLPVEELPNE